jgi:N-acetylglucosamine-6-phosphate deacetylase
VDLQVNGFGGADLLSGGDEAWETVATGLARAGTTTFLATLITAPATELLAGVRRTGRLMATGGPSGGARLAGVHLEGPFLAAGRLGGHPAAHRRDPSPGELAALLAAGPVALMTLAPELPGALELVAMLTAAGTMVSIGHTAATAAQASAGFDAGATAVTHLHNAMPPIAAREPGPAAVALTRGDVTVMLIADGVHLAPEVIRLAFAAARPRVALVSDGIAGAGVGDGTFTLGTTPVTVREGRATTDGGTLAGSTGTLAGAVRLCVELGIPVEVAVGAATAVPAALIGRPELGTLAPGTPADIAVLDEALAVDRVFVGGREVVS